MEADADKNRHFIPRLGTSLRAPKPLFSAHCVCKYTFHLSARIEQRLSYESGLSARAENALFCTLRA
jgi:hypothetical protein